VYGGVSASPLVAKATNTGPDVAQFLGLALLAARTHGGQLACLPADAAVKRFGACRIFVDGQAGAA
jgi:hypothetical protein